MSTTYSYSYSDNMFLRSATTGRERWQIDDLRHQDRLSYSLEKELNKEEHISRATANPLTGRVLIFFDANYYKEGTGRLIQKILERISLKTADGNALSAGETGSAADTFQFTHNPLFDLVQTCEGEKALRREAVTLSVLNTTFKITTPLLQGMIMACGMQGGFKALTGLGLSIIPQLGLLGAAYYASASMEKYIEYHRKQKWTAYSDMVEARLRERAYLHVHALPLSTLAEQEWGSAELTRFVKDDCGNVKMFLEESAPYLLDKGLTFTACSLLLLSVSPVAFLLAMAPLPIMYRLSRQFNQDNQQSHRLVKSREQELDRSITNSLNGLSTVKSYTAENWEQNRLKEVNESYQASYADAARERYKYHSQLQFGIYLGISMPIIYSSYNVSRGLLSFTAFSGTAFLLPQMILSTQGLDQDYAHYVAARRSAERIQRLLDCEQERVNGDRLNFKNLKGEIRFENVSFNYPKPVRSNSRTGHTYEHEAPSAEDGEQEAPTLRHVSFTIPPGDTVAFVGETGSGKSTLIKLLLRFYDPTEGRILLDGKDIRQINLFDLRQALGWVSQEVYLFEGSIADNIRYGTADVKREAVMSVAKLAAADEFIQAKKEGYDLEVGERGQFLSGGQRQRISVARALLKNSSILILDEATSSVDNLTEAKMHKAITNEYKNRTMVLVAHRLSSINDSDCIYLFENGGILESGTHKQLLAKGDRYAGMWKLQLDRRTRTANGS